MKSKVFFEKSHCHQIAGAVLVSIQLQHQNRMRRILSTQTFSFIKQKAIKSKDYGRHMATYVSVFTMVMKTCKGRDKICSVIQYMADLYYNCNKYSQIASVVAEFRAGINRKAIVAMKLRMSMKNCRKIFKFLKFLDQLSAIVKTAQSKKPLYLKVVIIMECLMAFFSSLFDNIIWGINTQVLDVWFSSKYKTIKSNKYFFSLCKIIFKMLSNNFKHHNRIRDMKKIITELKEHKDQLISNYDRTHQLCKDYIKHRGELRVQSTEGAVMIIRIVMLIRKLRLPGYTYVTKIIYSACGLVSTFLTVYEMIIDQPLLVEIKEKEKAEEELEGRFQSFNKVKKVNFARSGSLKFG